MRLGIDVGGTNTDGVVLGEGGTLLGAAKALTTPDILDGIRLSLKKLLEKTPCKPEQIKGIFVGTTHCLNAIYDPHDLAHTALIRICHRTLVKAAIGWPPELAAHLQQVFYLPGGYHWNGEKSESGDLNASMDQLVKQLAKLQVEAVAIISTFSPLYAADELYVGDYLKKALPGLSVSLSHQIGSFGFMERENSTLINAMLSKVLKGAIRGLSRVFEEQQLHCPYWFVQNDGSLMTQEEALAFPVLTIGSGASCSFRGASRITGLSDCIVVDVGGSTTEIGRIAGGQVEEMKNHGRVQNIRVNIRMPKLISLPSGGGSILSPEGNRVIMGRSVARDLTRDGIAWGGRSFTLSDAFLKLYPETFIDENIDLALLKHLPEEACRKAVSEYTAAVREAVECLQHGKEEWPVILVGGGSPMLRNRFFRFDKIIHPYGFQICNAIGACHAPASAQLDRVFWLEQQDKEEVIDAMQTSLFQDVVQKGGIPDKTHLACREEYPLTYLQGEVLRVHLKAEGELDL